MYKIINEDDSIFIGGTPRDSKWNTITKAIKSIEYTLGNTTVVMQGYEMYNHLVEYASILGKRNLMTRILLMGLKDGVVNTIIFDIYNKSIIKETSKIDYEYNNGKTTGWKKGVESDNYGFNFIEPIKD